MDVNAALPTSPLPLPAEDLSLLLGALALIALTLFLIFVIRRVIVNSILGVVAFILIKFLLGIDLPFLPTLIVSIVFGLAGVGTMLLLHFLGVL